MKTISSILILLLGTIVSFLSLTCSTSETSGYISIEIPQSATSLYNEVAAFKPTTNTIGKINISNLTKNFNGVNEAFVLEYDSLNFYEPTLTPINDNSIEVRPTDKNILVVLNLGETAGNNYSLLADFSRFRELTVPAIQNRICTMILCAPDIFKIDKLFTDIPEISEFKEGFGFYKGSIGKVPIIKPGTSLCEQCLQKPPKLIPCLYKGCQIFPFPRGPFVRKNFNTLTDAEKNSVKQGVASMKLKADTQTDSWIYQANMHGAPAGTPPHDLFNGCQHGTLQFLTWHRMYLYYFERILRKASADNKLTIPYWNYTLTNSRSLPLEFRSPADGTNSLYHAARNLWANDGGSLPAEAVDLSNAMAQSAFNRFSGSLEGTPHGAVHVQIGRDMGRVTTAARDPIFWLHHSNIDRVWNKWVQETGHLNPVDPAWLNTSFQFFNENGVKVSLSASDVLNTLDQLNYRYDDDPIVVPLFVLANLKNFQLPQDRPFMISAFEGNVKLADKPVRIKLELPQNKIDQLKIKLAPDSLQRFYLSFDNVEFQEPVGTSFRVFLNPKNNENLQSASTDSFVGLLNLFGSHEGHHPFKVEFDITALLSSMKNENQSLQTFTVVIVPLQPIPPTGGDPEKYRIKIEGNPTIKRLSLIERE